MAYRRAAEIDRDRKGPWFFWANGKARMINVRSLRTFAGGRKITPPSTWDEALKRMVSSLRQDRKVIPQWTRWAARKIICISYR